MSQRGKRPNCHNPVDGPSPSKRRKGRPPTISIDSHEEFTSPTNGGSTVWQARPHLDLKMSSIYNRSAPEAPAELFRKDLISAMKLPDSEPLSHEEYWVITDQWKQEWERGVQVPVNPDSLPEPSVRLNNENYYKARQDFKLPKNKYIRITKDENFSHDKHYLSNTPAIADSVCSYDLDQLDEAWLQEFNGERSMCGLPPVNEEQFERIIEELETRCHDKIQAIMKSEDGLGIEYDENVICDVCRSPDSEEANEMVFCDNCNICVHQACYGITTIPSGQWLCRTCSMGQKPDCVLCPNKGGAMKSTRSGQKWAHVSCALWIPEVSIGSVDRMEPITKISSIPQSRWALVCVLCRERVGACIQCSVKTCKTAYHVTCAFQHGLEMRAIIEDENAEDGVKLRSYCQKHSVKKEPKNSAKSEKTAVPACSASEDEEKTNKRKIRKEMTSEERNHARLARLVEIQSEFDKHVSVKDISCHLLDVDQEGINHIYNYWILKRKAGGNDPLLLPKSGDVECMSQSDQEQADVEKMKMFVHLRQDLERVRNLCYMVSRREKLSRSFFKMREQIFHKQISILSNHRKTTKLDDESLKAILDANHGPSIYDVLYSSNSIKDSRVLRIDEMIDLILGNNVSTTKTNKSLLEINGNVKKEKMDAISRYSKLFNGGNTSSNRKYNYDSITSDTDESATKQSRRKSHITSSSSAEDEPPPPTLQRSPTRSKNLSSSSNQLAVSAASSVNNSNITTPTSNANNQPKKKGRPLGSTKQATAEKRRLLNSISLVKENKSKALSIDSSSEDDIPPPPPPSHHHSKVKSPLSTRNRLMTDDNQHLTDESDELVPIRNSSGHSIPTQGGTIKKIHSSAIYSDSDSSSTDKDNRTDYTVSDSQQQPFRTKAAMKEFNENEVIPNFNKLKKIPDVQESSSNKKNAMSINKKSSTTTTPVTSPIPSKKHDLPPPSSTVKKETKPSPAKATKSRRMSTKLQNNSLSSDSEMEETRKPSSVKDISKDSSNKEPEKKSKSQQQPKKDILADFLVVPQREAAKKASENLMKTNSNLTVQASSTVVTTPNEKHKRDVKEKVEDVPTPSTKSSENEKEKQKESKDSKSSKSSRSTKDKSKADKKEEQKKTQDKTTEKEVKVKEKEKEKEKEEKIVSDFPSEFLPYVPQRQAAKKAAEHIKGLGNSSLQQTTSITEEKPKQPATSSATTKRTMPDRRKSMAVDLSSSTSSSSSSDSDESDSESDSVSQKPTNTSNKANTKPTSKALPTRRSSVAATAASLKQKTKDSPFLDKAAKSSVHVETSSSSSYESDSSSDRINTSRLSDKRNKSKRKSIEQPTVATPSAASKKVTPAASPKKSTNTVKKESDQRTPTRRMSTITKPPPITSPTVSKTNSKSAQKSSEPSKPVEQQITSSRKRSTSTASPPKVSSNSKSRATESSKRDLAKLSDKEKSSTDLKKPESRTSTPTPIIAAPSIIQPEKQTTTNQKTDSFEVVKKRRSSVVSTPKSKDKDKDTPKDDKEQKVAEIIKEPTKVNVERSKTPVVEKEKVIEPEVPVKEKEQPVVAEKKNEKIEKEKPVKEKEKPVKEKDKPVKEKEKPIEKKEQVEPTKFSDVIEINDESENDEQRKPVRAEIKEKEKDKEKSKISAFDDDISVVKMDIDETISEPKPLINVKQQIVQESKFQTSPKTNIPMTSPMVSIPTENLNRMQEKSNENKQLANEPFKSMPITGRQETSTSNANTMFEPIKPLSIEDTERESYNLIEKLKKNKKPTNATIISDNNNVAIEKPNEMLKPCMMQNENTPKHDNFDQIAQPQIPLRPPNASPLTECNELKKLSPWHQQQQQSQQQAQSHSINENANFPQRNILTSSCNKLNSPMDQTSTPPSCMVIEQQQKQLAACQKMSEENNMMVSNRASMFMSQMNMLMNDPTANHMDVFEMQMQQQQQQQQQQKWHKDPKSMNLKMMQQQQQQHERMQENLIKRSDSGMENMMNNMNQPMMKNFAAMQKSPGNFVPMQQHMGPQQPQPPQQPQENFNAYNYSDHANQFTSAVSLFPPDLNVQVPFPSPGQAMYAPNFANTFTNAQQHNQNNDHSMMMQTSSAHIKLNSNEMTSSMHFGGQNVCPPNMFNPQQQQPILPNDLQMIPNIPPNNTMDCSNLIPTNLDKQQPQDIAKKSPSKSTRSSPRNTTPNYVGGKTPQKSPSKSPRQPSTPASIESLSRQNSQKGKMTPTTNEGKQRKSRSNSQASPVTTPADHRAANNKARQRANKNTKGRFPQNAMPFMPFNNEADYIAIDKKLVGTVYDFSADEDFPTSPSVENLTLRAMRDRRKSVDLYNKMNKDGSSQSPKFMKSSLKPSTPLSHPLAINNHTMPNTVVNESEQLPVTASSITNLNLVNMPGPVDMRTYNSFDNTNDSYSSQLLGAFATNTVDQTLNEIDEEQEKELQTALKASNDKQKTPTTNASSNVPSNTETTKNTTEVSNIVEESVDSEASFAKVSLSDSRNQLKLKIKGPLAHHHDLQSQSVTHAQIAPQTTSSATSSNRRQMRKKELLQQYWNQGNTDQEPLSIVSNDQQAPSHISSNRVGGIPKAVDSMGLSLLKDEFQDFNYAEYKKRKRFALRGVDPLDVCSSNLDVSNVTNEVDPLAIDTNTNNKKRSRRPGRGNQQQNQMGTPNPPPKLKIKIGADIMETTGSDLPPKKRLIAQPPSYQDLKRESMNFRKQMMEEFSEQSKEQRQKQEKRERKEKKKRKKEKKRSVEIVSKPITEGAPVKLILKISNKSSASLNTSASSETSSNKPSIINEQEVKSTPPPIKLKLSRNSTGKGEYNILNSSASNVVDKQKTIDTNNSSVNNQNTTSVSNPNNNNNNLQPPIIDASDINAITTKKLEVSLERIEDIEKAKSEFSNKQMKETSKDDVASNNCEVR